MSPLNGSMSAHRQRLGRQGDAERRQIALEERPGELSAPREAGGVRPGQKCLREPASPPVPVHRTRPDLLQREARECVPERRQGRHRLGKARQAHRVLEVEVVGRGGGDDLARQGGLARLAGADEGHHAAALERRAKLGQATQTDLIKRTL